MNKKNIYMYTHTHIYERKKHKIYILKNKITFTHMENNDYAGREREKMI